MKTKVNFSFFLLDRSAHNDFLSKLITQSTSDARKFTQTDPPLIFFSFEARRGNSIHEFNLRVWGERSPKGAATAKIELFLDSYTHLLSSVLNFIANPWRFSRSAWTTNWGSHFSVSARWPSTDSTLASWARFWRSTFSKHPPNRSSARPWRTFVRCSFSVQRWTVKTRTDVVRGCFRAGNDPGRRCRDPSILPGRDAGRVYGALAAYPLADCDCLEKTDGKLEEEMMCLRFSSSYRFQRRDRGCD